MYIYNHLADEIKDGVNDENFTDPRGGFISPLMFAETFFNKELTGANKTQTISTLQECRELLTLFNVEGWSINVNNKTSEIT